MGAGKIHTSKLDNFVKECDNLGGPENPNARNYLLDFYLKFDTKVDQNLDPFSNDYYQSQIDLYKEISGRSIDQSTWEQAPVEVEKSIFGVNPYGSNDINFISKHSRAVLTTLYLANLPPSGKILDMGSGWGLSSEIIAFCGGHVTCVDINPLFIELNKRRITRLNLPVEIKLSNFDSYEDDQKYDLVLFYESLHHSVKPWETIKHISKFVNSNGKVAFAGEPINKLFWKNWGLRLDPLSVYCIRKFGWFESGWSKKFISKAFEYAGLKLILYPGVGLNHGYIGIATKSSEHLNPKQSFNLDIASSSFHSNLAANHLSYEQIVFLRKAIDTLKAILKM
ncbi:MAG: class I SAM-dependent methyltransferase [Nodosilinea sp.]